MKIISLSVETKAKAGFDMEGFAMKMRNFFFAAALVVTAASCVKENAPESSEKTTVNYVPMEFTSAVETKTVLADGKVNWLEGDKISIFDNSSTAETHNNSFVTTGDGSFTGTVPEDATEFYALYPYREASSLTEGAIKINLPAEQTATPGSFADDLAIMVAKADGQGKLAFKNVCSHIKFTLANDLTDVRSITLMGNKAEILAGPATVDMSDGDPKITVSITNSALTYVTLRNSGEEKSALVPGDYYFTVLPVEFTEGFTVILSMMDGTQVAKKTTKFRNELASRNSILVMKPLAASDYTEHMNYFVKYNDGFDLTFGEVTINKKTHPNGILASDNRTNSGNVAAKVEGGVYFIHPSSTQAKFNKAEAFKSLVVIGADASQRSDIDFYRQARPYDGGSLILLANLRCTVGDKNAFAHNTNTTGHSFKTFSNMVLSNCHFKKIGKHFMQFNASAFTKFNLMVEDCEFGIKELAKKETNLYFLNTGSNESTAQNVTFKNNIFYAESPTAATAFKLVNSDKLTIDKFNAESNTFDNTIPEENILRIGDISTSFDMAKNLFYETSKTAGTVKLIAFPVGKNAKNATGTTTNNVYYNSTSGAELGLGIGTSGFANMSINSIKQLTSKPMSTSWDPANEKYGAYVFESGVSNTIGAKRADMVAQPNSASYHYPATDLGSF